VRFPFPPLRFSQQRQPFDFAFPALAAFSPLPFLTTSFFFLLPPPSTGLCNLIPGSPYPLLGLSRIFHDGTHVSPICFFLVSQSSSSHRSIHPLRHLSRTPSLLFFDDVFFFFFHPPHPLLCSPQRKCSTLPNTRRPSPPLHEVVPFSETLSEKFLLDSVLFFNLISS